MEILVLLGLIIVFFLIGLCWIYTVKIIDVLRKNHPELYDELGQPTANWRMSGLGVRLTQKGTSKILLYALKGRFSSLGDAELTSLQRGLTILWLTMAGVWLFSLVMLIIGILNQSN